VRIEPHKVTLPASCGGCGGFDGGIEIEGHRGSFYLCGRCMSQLQREAPTSIADAFRKELDTVERDNERMRLQIRKIEHGEAGPLVRPARPIKGALRVTAVGSGIHQMGAIRAACTEHGGAIGAGLLDAISVADAPMSVLLEGDEEAVRGAAQFFGENVTIKKAGE